MTLFSALGSTWGGRFERLVENGIFEHRWVLALAAILLAIPMWLVITTPLSLAWQTIFGLGIFAVVMRLRMYEGQLVTLLMMLMSVLASSRYLYWRLTETLGVGLAYRDSLDVFFSFGLVGAEIYAYIVLLLGFFQVMWPLNRKPVPLPEDTSLWPSVDIFIPSYNEPLAVVRPTVLAALEIDWPADRLNVYVLDDGRREEFKTFCEQVGATHITRSDSKHAKAGNINRALEKTNGEFIAIFDCDHVPTRSFLQITIGSFVKDPKMALVQTPHHFFSPDPFERNLGTFRKVPNEGELFYGLLQDGNDLWDATFFCGSCAVLRRTALLEVGGIAVETVTEDAHTSLKMHGRGWRSAYLNIPQAAGLATESLSAHVGQRIRWARGMAQIFRIDNPFLRKGLSFGQRLCYANAMLHFFYGLPRIVFLTAPLSYLFFEAHIIEAAALTILAYAAPHLVLANIANSRIQGPYRHSFWAEVYESVLATYILMPTTMALINPKLGTFNVTAKGGMVENEYFDRDIAAPYLALLVINLIGLGVGVMRFMFWNTHELDTVLLNMVWTVYNLVMIGAALSVAWESKQVRRTVRVDAKISALVEMPDRRIIEAHTVDISEGGTGLLLVQDESVPRDASVRVALAPDYREVWLPAKVTRSQGKVLSMRFDTLNIEQQKQLVYAIFGRADAWVSWTDQRHVDRPGAAFKEVVNIGIGGVVRMFSEGLKQVKQTVKSKMKKSATAATAMIVSVLIGLATVPAPAEAQGGEPAARSKAEEVAPGSASNRSQTTDRVLEKDVRTLTLEDLGVARPIRLRGVQGEISIPVNIRDDEVVSSARFHLIFSHSPALLRVSHFNVLINNELAATIPLSEATASGLERTIELDPRLFVQYNQIGLQLIAHYTDECEDPVHSSLWGIVSNRSSLELNTEPLVLPNDLNLLPSPFFDPRDSRRLTLPFVFAGEPSLDELEAAGVVASWFGAMASYRGARFPVYINEMPPGHGVVFAVGGKLPVGLPADGGGTSVSVVGNPRVNAAKLLVVRGTDGAALKRAAHALAMGSEALAGQSTSIGEFEEPAPRMPYDAPRWIPTDREVAFSEIAQPWQLQVSGLYPDAIRVNFHLPPDLFAWRSDGLKLNLKYRYTPTVGSKSTLNVNINDEFVEAIALSYTGEDKAAEDRINLPFVAQYEAVNEGSVYVPDYKFSADNQLQFQYYFERKKEGACKDVVIDNLRGGIDEDSTIDVTSLPHFTFLPDLALFANGGFPFTRLADLSETGIVFPQQATADEVAAYLTIMGRLGNATGYPAIRFKLVRAGDIAQLNDRDILVLGAAGNQPLLEQWAEYMPMSVAGGQTRLRVIGPVERLQARWEGHDLEGALRHAGRVILEAGRSLGAVMSFESPLSSKRTVVVLTAGDEARQVDVAELFTDSGKIQFIRGDLVLLNGDELNHYQLADSYSVGHLPFFLGLRWWFSKQPLLLVIFVVLIALVLAVILYRLLRRAALSRKSGHS